MRTRISLMLPLICAPLAFWGCGDDSSSTKAKGDSAEVGADSDIVVETFDELAACSDEREGATAYVQDEKTAYICEDGEWVEKDDPEDGASSSGNAGSSSSGNAGSSSSGNAGSSSSGNAGSSSSGNAESSSSGSPSGAEGSSGSDSSVNENSEVVKVKNKTITGVSQKGPFVSGSVVKLYELDSETYAQTGKSFTGEISSDNGEFTVSGVTLANQYAQLEVNGNFHNEVTGEKSSGVITLNALADLSNREKVNINLLTHLEYKRVLYLVGTGIDVPEAKKQAEAEIFNAFGIQGDFANSEDLNIFSKGDGSAALLAFSVLMQGDRSEAELAEFLTKFAADIEKDGEWNAEATKTKVADWAVNQDLEGGLGKIRSNVNGWDLGLAPAFEKYVRNFWYTNYGLGACDDDSKGVVKAVENELSKIYGTSDRFICKSGAWVYASGIEKDTYKWSAGDDGEVKTGDVISSNKYVYDGKLEAWREATLMEGSLGGCTEGVAEDLEKNTGKLDGTWYICKNGEWKSTDNIIVDTQGWAEGSDGSLKLGNKNSDVWYKYDETLDKWGEADDNDVGLGLNGCTVKRSGEVSESSETYYICKDSQWQEATEIEYDTYGKKCTSAEVGSTINGVVTETNRYYCSADGWFNLRFWSWDIPKEARLNPKFIYGSMVDSRDGREYKTVLIGSSTWMAENLNFDDKRKMPILAENEMSWCYKEKPGNCDVGGRLYTWVAAIDSVGLAEDESDPQKCGYKAVCTRLSADKLATKVVQGVCPIGWHLPSAADFDALLIAAGGSANAGEVLKSAYGWEYSKKIDGSGTDAKGFSALPVGIYHPGVSVLFAYEKTMTRFWSATQTEDGEAYSLELSAYSKNASIEDTGVHLGYSVRCVKNSK